MALTTYPGVKKTESGKSRDGKRSDSEKPKFIADPRPTTEAIKKLTETLAKRLRRLLEKRGVIGECDIMDPL